MLRKKMRNESNITWNMDHKISESQKNAQKYLNTRMLKKKDFPPKIWLEKGSKKEKQNDENEGKKLVLCGKWHKNH